MSYDNNPAPHPSSPDGTYYYLDEQGYLRQYVGDATAAASQNAGLKSWVNYQDKTYLAGFAVGVGLALILSNAKVQKTLISGAVKCWNGVQGGVEEVKEKIKDAQAELSREE